jgi:DNA-binding LytR/AlgR family response regulator
MLYCMINVVIIEDEDPARRKLRRFLNDVQESVKVVAELTTIAEAIPFLRVSKDIDLILSDIELLDGNAFDIYNEVAVTSPIIFITAYNHYLLKAFETNGIEYLLKPYSFERFTKAWNKFLLLKNKTHENNDLLIKVRSVVKDYLIACTYKKRFSISSRRGIFFVEVDTILFFEADEGVVVAIDVHAKRHILSETTLKEIYANLDPYQFFRISRSNIVNKTYIERYERYTKNTVALKMRGYTEYIITSQNTTALFREWVIQ